jgi:alpha-glucan,water dikinase
MERVSLALQSQAEEIYSMTQPKAEEFGKALNSNPAYISTFAEEVIRGSGGLVLSQILACLAGPVRDAGQLGVWELASSIESATGELKVMDDLVGIQGQSFDTPQVLFVNKIGGMEDIPPGVVAILSPMGVDVLSHIAIRARNQKVLLASCHDAGAYGALVEANKAHKFLKVSVDGNHQVACEAAESAGGVAGGGKGSAKSVTLAAPDLGPSKAKYVLVDSAFAQGCLGGKSNNLQLLRKPEAKALLGDDVQLPSSVALPFGAFERVLALPSNGAVVAKLTQLENALTGKAVDDEKTLQEMRDTIVNELQPPPELHAELVAACSSVGMPADLTEDDEACFDSIKQVWARSLSPPPFTPLPPQHTSTHLNQGCSTDTTHVGSKCV